MTSGYLNPRGGATAQLRAFLGGWPPTARRTLLCGLAVSVLLGLLTAGRARAEPQRYTLDPAHSWVQWELMHFGTSTIRGRLGPAAGSVTLDRSAGRGEVGITLPMASVSTGFGPFDAHLRRADLLDTETYPSAWFVARQLTFDGNRLASLRGELSWRDFNRPLTLTAVRFACHTHPRLQREVCGGDFEGELLRSDFALSYGLPFVADKVVLRVQVEAVRDE